MMEDPIPPSTTMAASTATTTTSPKDADIQRPLAEDIVVTTRKVHARINKLIMARLPLALPPHATDCGPYISGMLHFIPIYTTFEKLWQDILDNPPTSDTAGNTSNGSRDTTSHPVVCERIYSILKNLYIPGLMRSDRFKSDIRASTGWSDDILNEQLEIIGKTGRIGDFVSHIKRAVHNKPHVFIAYSYIMFMALFAGGRFIRASFEKAGDEFWETVPEPIKPTLQPCDPDAVSKAVREPASQLPSQAGPDSRPSHSIPLRFWNFETAEDGEDLKREYKEKLLDWEDKLTPEERHDVIQESICVFENVGLIVGQIDEAWQEQENKPNQNRGSSLLSQLGARLRDSAPVTKEHTLSNTPALIDEDEDDEEEDDEEEEEKSDGTPPTGIDLCPGIPKSIKLQYAKSSLPIPPHNHPAIVDGKSGGGLKIEPQRLTGVSMSQWVMASVVGMLLLWSLSCLQQLGLSAIAVRSETV